MSRRVKIRRSKVRRYYGTPLALCSDVTVYVGPLVSALNAWLRDRSFVVNIRRSSREVSRRNRVNSPIAKRYSCKLSGDYFGNLYRHRWSMVFCPFNSFASQFTMFLALGYAPIMHRGPLGQLIIPSC